MPKSRVLLVVAVAIGVLASSYPALGYTPHAGAFLRMGVGARALGMGGAFTAIADDATAAYWNPAGLTKIENNEATFSYTANMAVDRSLNYGAYARWLGVGGLGVSWLNAGMMDMPKIDKNKKSWGTDDTGENAIMFSYGMEVGSIMLGATAKILHENMPDLAGDQTETGFGLDLGGMFSVTDNITAGLMIRDVGSQYGDNDVPLNWRFGSAVKALDGALCVGLDADKIQGQDNFELHLGAEYGMEVRPGYHAFFRSGLNSIEDRAFTAGLGIRVPIVQFDYTYVTEKDEDVFGSNHRISVTARW